MHERGPQQCWGKKKQLLSHFEGVVFDGFDDVVEEHFGRDCVAVVDYGLAVWPVPAV